MAAHKARKRFGQHFLTDESIPAAIVRAVSPSLDDNIVEIGPGLSALTAPLLEQVKHLTVVEIDRDLAHRLRHQYSPTRLTVIEADALTVDFNQFDQGVRIVGNLPYNISSPLLFHLMNAADKVKDQHFMLQKEVIDRMVARPGEADYGRLSVMLQARYKMHALMDVPPECFTPPPKVMSAVVRMIPLGEERPKPKDEALFARIVAQAFMQRRKMLRGSLKEWGIDWQGLGIPETARAEELSVGDFIKIADFCLP
ncbi:16S rRNA (adenine(1518)-N(6)/adenine(1519)-N(6))-dimethyltransferase RsmA [Pelistega ratti]|uniref:16S rRNA (adenine(1518)-N(6)/adenine(1519)-N(6))- dimethyltransferase RsmA n=1 Tax=Pelistega ratti TaxID=2652177 RepID=UPI00135B7FE2|nr:16S rRNA (adenine(1518)-N(6)/adenine(1519)-N(6))-dimethyltransferase RsmA [Pelistega ratti]